MSYHFNGWEIVFIKDILKIFLQLGFSHLKIGLDIYFGT